MAQRNVTTQTSLNDIKLVLNDIAASLSQHLNDSMSRAHGINIWPGYVDSQGNDYTKYRNQNGDVVGDFIVSFLVGGVMYFAPAKSTALTGQPFTNGNIDISATNPSTVGSSSWVTDFASSALASTTNTRDQVLVPHTREGHWESHGGMTVIAKESFDAAGVLIGRYVLQFQYGGQLYQIPCDTSFTGLPLPLSVSLDSTYLYFPNSSGSFSSQHPSGFPVTATAVGGTGPYTFEWHYRDDADPSTDGLTMTTSPISYNSSLYPSVAFTISSVSPLSVLNILSITNHLPGSGTKNFYFFCKITDATSATATSDILRIQYYHG